MCYKYKVTLVTVSTHREGDGDGGEDKGHPLVPLPLLLLPPRVQSQPRILLQEVQNLYREYNQMQSTFRGGAVAGAGAAPVSGRGEGR